MIAGDYIVPSEKFVADVLLDWKNIIVSNAVIIPFSVKNATKFFKDYQGFYRNLALRTYKVWRNNLADEAVQ